MVATSWGIIKAPLHSRQDAANTFLSTSVTASTRCCATRKRFHADLVGKEKQKGIDLHVLDLVDKDKQSTRYYISAKNLQFSWLEYEDPLLPVARQLIRAPSSSTIDMSKHVSPLSNRAN